MWSSIANLKENLNKIALDVHDDDDDDDDELSISGHDSPYIDRRRSHSKAHSKSTIDSPMSNGVDSPYVNEIEQYKAEIKKLGDSEAEIKALSVNYAALLKEKEVHIGRLNHENGSLKQNLDVTKADLRAFKNNGDRASPNSSNGPRRGGQQSQNRQSTVSTVTKNHSTGNKWQNGIVLKQDGYTNGLVNGVQVDLASKQANSHEKELADMLDDKNRLLDAARNDYELQMKKMTVELEKERKDLVDLKLKLQDEKRSKDTLTVELNNLRSNTNKLSVCHLLT